MGDFHITRITNSLFSNSIDEGKSYLNGFTEASIKRFLDFLLFQTWIQWYWMYYSRSDTHLKAYYRLRREVFVLRC